MEYHSACLMKVICIILIGIVFIAHGRILQEQAGEQERVEGQLPFRVKLNSLEMVSIYRGNYNLENLPYLYGDQREMALKTQLFWSNLVVIILIYNGKQSNRLVKAHLTTWIERAGEGLDIVFVTDVDDDRTYDEIVPNADKVKPTIHVYRSDALKEGTLARAKVIDSFSYVQKKFEGNKNKNFFIKIDTDTFLIAEHILKPLNELHQLTHPLPVDFGLTNCFSKVCCYTQGGFYGMNRAGLNAALNYLSKNKGTYDETVESLNLPGENLIRHEDFFTSYLFRKATGFPSISVPGISDEYILMGTDLQENAITEQISIHKAKPCQRYVSFEDSFYDENGQLRWKFELVQPKTVDIRCWP